MLIFGDIYSKKIELTILQAYILRYFDDVIVEEKHLHITHSVKKQIKRRPNTSGRTIANNEVANLIVTNFT